MNYWIFQAIPERYDLREHFPKDDASDKEATWYATRYRSQMEPGDLVFFWLGGDEQIRGIYGWGHLTSKAYIKKNWDSYGVVVRGVKAKGGGPGIRFFLLIPCVRLFLSSLG